MNVIKVQDCGCIALPEELATATGLHPGATLSVELAQDKSIIIIRPIERKETAPISNGAQCR